MTLRLRIFLILLAVALAPVLITGAWFLRSNARIKENTQALHRQVVGLAVDVVENWTGEFNRSLAFAEDLERDARASGSRASEFLILQNAANAHPAFALLELLDAAGRETVGTANVDAFADSGTVDRSSEPVVASAVRTGRLSVSPVAFREGLPIVTFAYPLERGGAVFGVYGLKTLWKRLDAIRVGRTGRILLIGADGRPFPGVADGFPERDWVWPRPREDSVDGWSEDIPTAAGVMVGAYRSAPSLGWTVASLESRSEAFAAGEGFYLGVALFLLCLGAVVLCVAYWTSGRVTEPILALVDGAARASRNEFDAPVPEAAWGELRLLSRTFNKMMSTLKTYQGMQIVRFLEEKARVDSLVQTIADGVVMSGFDGEILYVNRAAASILGIPDGGPGARRVHEWVREPMIRRMVLSIMKRDKPAAAADVEMKSPEGRRLGIYQCGAVSVRQGGREIGVLLTLHDVTAERELDAMKEEFMHTVVHDLRNPVATIKGFVELMQEKIQVGETEKPYWNFVRMAIAQLEQLISDILDSAKLESGTFKLKLEPLPVPALFERLRSLFALQGRKRGVDVRFECGKTPDSLRCDAALVERVLQNLIGNSLKFTPNGGRVTVSAAAVDGAAEFSVADTGPGIPKDKLEFVFEKFKQLDKDKEARSGYGLGLSFCKRVVEVHGGKIWAESEPGRGTRLVFRIPTGPALS